MNRTVAPRSGVNDLPLLRRRNFLQVVAASSTGFALGGWSGAATARGPYAALIEAGAPDIHPTAMPLAFIRIGTDNTVTVIVKHLESGQGIFTGLPTLVAEEMDAAWPQMRAEGAPANKDLYSNLLMGLQATGASNSTPDGFMQYRLAGAAARSMLVAAAAEQWKVSLDSISVSDGVVSDASGRRSTFGELALAAAKQPVPKSPTLKNPKKFKLVGKDVIPRTDVKAKSTGTAIYTLDFHLPGMLTAVVAHAPKFGSRLASFDEAATSKQPGVRFAVAVPTGVAVLGDNFWLAKRARDQMLARWNDDAAMSISSADITSEYKRLCQTEGTLARAEGDTAAAVTQVKSTLQADYEFPYLAHACMEPLNCVIQLGADRCDLWYGAQAQTPDQGAVAQIVGLKPEQVFLNQLYAGGSFGRRGNVSATFDFVGEAASIAKAMADKGKRGIPIKLVWTREDDMRGGFYRPTFFHTVRAGLDAKGQLVTWDHRIAGQSIAAGTFTESFNLKDGVDHYSVEGAATTPYAIPNLRIELHTTKTAVPVLWWRGVGFSHASYVTETLLDRVAAAGGKDPLAMRKSLLTGYPKHLATLDLAAKMAGWGTPLKAGAPGDRRARGIAIQESYNTIVAQVAEVTVRKDGSFSVDRVVCAVNCGFVINPDVVRAQMEGGIGWGLSAAIHGAITIKDGAVVQSNFHDYQVLRINEMPVVDVHIVPSNDYPTGVGECGVAPIAPAVANAIAAASGQWLTKLPFQLVPAKA
jgi:isoquinoline 1-oxidoreductase subunit beta